MGRKKSKKPEYEFGVVDGAKQSSAEIDPNKVKENYLEILYYQIKQKNGLLGNFDNEGKYKISDPKIIESLLKVPKHFGEKVDNVIYASAKKGSVVLNFKIELDNNPDFSSATLYLIEIEHGIEEDVKHLTQIDKYLNIYSPTFRDEVFKEWKIWTDDDVFEKDDYLFEYLRFQEEELLFNRELTEILAQLYLVRILKLLEMSGELGQKILQEYKLLIEKLQAGDPGFSQSNTNLKSVLDYVLIKHNAIGEIIKTQGAPAVISAYANPLKRIKDKVPVSIKETTTTEEKKEGKKEEKKQDKKETPKKPKAKAKGNAKAPKSYKFDTSKIFNGEAKAVLPKSKETKKGPEKKVEPKKPQKEPEEEILVSDAAARRKRFRPERINEKDAEGERMKEDSFEPENIRKDEMGGAEYMFAEGRSTGETFSKRTERKDASKTEKFKEGKERSL